MGTVDFVDPEPRICAARRCSSVSRLSRRPQCRPSLTSIMQMRHERASILQIVDSMSMSRSKGDRKPQLRSAIRGQLIANHTLDPATSGSGVYVLVWFGESKHRRYSDGRSSDSPFEVERRPE